MGTTYTYHFDTDEAKISVARELTVNEKNTLRKMFGVIIKIETEAIYPKVIRAQYDEGEYAIMPFSEYERIKNDRNVKCIYDADRDTVIFSRV